MLNVKNHGYVFFDYGSNEGDVKVYGFLIETATLEILSPLPDGWVISCWHVLLQNETSLFRTRLRVRLPYKMVKASYATLSAVCTVRRRQLAAVP